MIHINKKFGQSSSSIRQAAGVVVRNQSNLSFVEKRKEYTEQLSDIRKKWREQHLDAVQKDNDARAATRKRVILERAMRDRERNKQALILQEKFRASQELSRKLNRERFQRNQHIRNLNFEARSLRYQLLLKDLESEKSHWIRRDNMTSKITDELFEEPCTTGLISKTSYYWRYHPISIKLNRKMSEEYYKMFVAADGLSDSKSSQNALAKKLMVEDFLEPLVSTGKERQSYKELVKEFSEKFQNLHAFEGYEWYFDFYADQFKDFGVKQKEPVNEIVDADTDIDADEDDISATLKDKDEDKVVNSKKKGGKASSKKLDSKKKKR